MKTPEKIYVIPDYRDRLIVGWVGNDYPPECDMDEGQKYIREDVVINLLKPILHEAFKAGRNREYYENEGDEEECPDFEEWYDENNIKRDLKL